jgi:hypothetical protein
LPCRFNICPPQCWSPDIELAVRPRPSAGPGAGRFVRRPGPRAEWKRRQPCTHTQNAVAVVVFPAGAAGRWPVPRAGNASAGSAQPVTRERPTRCTRRVAGSATTSFRRPSFRVSAGARQSRRDRRHPTTNTMAPADAMRAATVSGIVRRSSMGPLHWRAFPSVFPGLQLRLVAVRRGGDGVVVGPRRT